MTDINEAKQNTIDSARKKASQKGKRAVQQTADKQLTSYEDLVGNYETSIVTTTSGKTFEIQSITPGVYFLITGTPLMGILSEKGLDVQNAEERQKAIEELSDEEKLEFITNDGYIEFMQRTCCAGIVSVNFVMKRQRQCNKFKKEVSIDLLEGNDLFELFTAIMNISASESAGDLVETFQSENTTEQERHDTDTSDE